MFCLKQYDFKKVVCKFLKLAIYIYRDEFQTPSVQDQKDQIGLSVKGIHGIFSLKYDVKPPPKRLRSGLKTFNPLY